MQKKLTVTIDQAVYDGFHRTGVRGHVSRFLEDLARLPVRAARWGMWEMILFGSPA